MRSSVIPVLFLILLFSCRTASDEEGATYVADAEYIQIVLFHLAQRCESCTAVEQETLALLEEEYGEEVAAGKVKFVSLNFQSEKGRSAATQLKASGQTLYVTKGVLVSDLTSFAFMYAHTHPERYREALKQELDNYLN